MSEQQAKKKTLRIGSGAAWWGDRVEPAGLNADQIAAAVDEAIKATGASAAADMGKLMAVLKPQLAGKADMAEVSKLVKSRLSN